MIKLPRDEYEVMISSNDVVVSMIFSAHPGGLAFEVAASCIPTVTKVFDNRDAAKLKQISDNLMPYDPVRESLLDNN